MHLTELKTKSIDQLRKLADESGATAADGLRRHELLVEVLRGLGRSRTEIRAAGVLEVLADGFGFLRCTEDDFRPGSEDVYVSPSQIRRFELRTGDAVEGVIRAPKEGERYFALLRVETVNDLEPDSRPSRRFEQLGALRPESLLPLEGADHRWLRLIDALAPMGRGQRCLIEAPAGNTSILIGKLATHLGQSNGELHVIAILLEARPEDVLELRSSVTGTVVAAPMGESPLRQVQLADMALARARRLVELGQDVVVAIDSLSALYQARFTTQDSDSPGWAPMSSIRSALASARRVEGGGSLTLFAAIGGAETVREAVAGAGNARVCLRRLPDGRTELDPRETRTDRPEDVLPSSALSSLWAARGRLAEGPIEGACDRAAEIARSGGGSDVLRRALSS